MSRSRKPRAPASSTRSRPRLSSLADLITQSQNTIASSQATVYSTLSQRTAPTQDSFTDQEIYQDLMTEDVDNLRITPEEERRIQSLLELARKGKINPGNAFDMPVRVVDPQVGQGESMRFWKFASELLSASMGIYDKRVEHVFMRTNRMFDSLVRVGSHAQQEEEQEQQRSRRHRGLILKIDVESIGRTDSMASYDFGSLNCEDPSRLNLKKSFMLYNTDAMFTKRLQAFDSDSLKSLFLNAFQTGNKLEVLFFHQALNDTVQRSSQANLQKIDEKSEQQSTEPVRYRDQYPSIVEEQYKKLKLIANTSQIFISMGHFRHENQREGLFEGGNLIEDLHRELQALMSIETNKQHQTSEDIYNQHSSNLSLANDQTLFTQYSEELPIPCLEQTSSTQGTSQWPESRFFLSSRSMQTSREGMTPGQLEFKGLKLQKRRKRGRGERREGQQQTKRKVELAQDEIDFLDRVKLKRELVFQTKDQLKEAVSSKFIDRFILPMDVDPFKLTFSYGQDTDIGKKTVGTPAHQFSTQLTKNDQNFEAIDFNFDSQAVPQASQANQQWEIESEPFANRYSRPATNYRPQDTWSIRQVKEKLYQIVAEAGQLRLSQLDLGMSSSSVLVIVLHLANELKVSMLEEGDDLVLSVLRQD